MTDIPLDTLRWSSSEPNLQNVSKQGEFSLRPCFGPEPDREWWALDAANIELRIPAYEAGEEEMLQLFERPNDPPYFGSNHLLVSHILHPKLFEECRGEGGIIDGRIFKSRYDDSWYQWVKNGNFAVQYGAIEQSGTADRAYHVPGAQKRIQARFRKIAQLNQQMIRQAEVKGYVETIPDRSIDPTQGYPLQCTRTEWGRILPTVPLNYHVQGTAMWWMGRAMSRCSALLHQWRIEGVIDAWIVSQVHDELIFSFPKGSTFRTNLPFVRQLKYQMELGGSQEYGIGIPIPVTIKYHPVHWGEGESIAA